MRHYSLFLLSLSFFLTACSSDFSPTDTETLPTEERRNKAVGKFFGEDSLNFGGSKRKQQDEDHGLGVNSYLWRASLDTIAFMPLLTADPFGGVILTDWYSPPSIPNERFKLNIYILDRQLRSDGIKVTVFHQDLSQGHWVDRAANPSVARDLETAILKRARHYKTLPSR